MKHPIVILGVVLALMLIFTGSALAQDNPAPLPHGDSLLFLTTLKNNEQNHLTSPPIPEPGWIKYQGPCEPDSCEVRYAIRFGNTVVMDVGEEFNLSPGGATFYPAGQRQDVGAVYFCFEGTDCLPGMLSPTFQSASTSSWTGARFTQVDLPPDIDGELYERIVSWYYQKAIHYTSISQPANIPVYTFNVRGLTIECDDFVVPSLLPMGERSITTVQYRPTGIISCWSNLTQSWQIALIVEWISADGNPYSAKSELMKYDLAMARADMVRIADIKTRQLQVFAHVYGEDVVLYRDIETSPRAARRFEFPDWGEMGTAIGAGATGVAGGIGYWIGSRFLPALDGAAASILIIVQPERFICPVYDKSPTDNVPPQVICGAISINQ